MNKGQSVAGFDSRLKYYELLYSLMKESIDFLNLEDYDKSLQNIKIWKGLLPFKSSNEKLQKDFNSLINKSENNIKRMITSNSDRIKYDIRKCIIDLHALLNNFMHEKNMHIPTKKEYDLGTIVENVIYD